MIYPINRPAVLKAVKAFHETVDKNNCFALTMIWNTCKEPDTCQSNFESALMSEESFAYAAAEMIRVEALKYKVDPKKLLKKISACINEENNNEENSSDRIRGEQHCESRKRNFYDKRRKYLSDRAKRRR